LDSFSATLKSLQCKSFTASFNHFNFSELESDKSPKEVEFDGKTAYGEIKLDGDFEGYEKNATDGKP
jgi:hypothetical protein